MPLTLDQAQELVAELSAELENRSGEAQLLSDYYRGEQPLRFASSEFREFFAERYEQFSDNWCAVVADAPVERLTVTGVKPYRAEKADVESWRVWMANGLDADSQLGFLGSVVASRSFCLVWGDPADADTPKVTFEDASQAVVAYAPGSRRERVAGLRVWQDGETEFACLYMPDELWKFERPVSTIKQQSPNLAAVSDDLRRWKPRELAEEPNPQRNPMGEVPLVELPNRPTLADDPISDIRGVVPMQDAVNVVWAFGLNAADFASFPQRAVLGAELPKVPILDDQGNVVGERPVELERFSVEKLLWIEPNAEGNTPQIAEWTAANLSNYTILLDQAIGHIAAQTRTPQHYLIGKMANLSGDALIAAETGLVKRTQEKQLWLGQALREVFRLIALAQGNTAKADALVAGSVLWADAESRNMAQLTDSLLKLKTIGFPFEFLAARYGLTPTEVAEVVAMKQREAELDPVAQLMNGGGPVSQDAAQADQQAGQGAPDSPTQRPSAADNAAA